MNAAPAPFQSASLYVGDLNNEVTEGLLFEMFNKVGPVASIRVCRDAVTRRSLGYAYVNFHNVQDAERTLDTMNFTDIKGNACRIMWSQRDPSLRKSGVGNVFIKNVAPSVDNKILFDTFSVFGNILSCKVVCDENFKSKGYAYVHYETAEAANEAISKFSGCQIEDYEVEVLPFLRRQERPTEAVWTNLYAKMFPESWTEDRLKAEFAPFGVINSVSISKDGEGKSKRFGFVDFADHECAVKAIESLNGKVMDDEEGSFELYVGKAQKKIERTREIKSKLESIKQERATKNQGRNLFVKNLEETVTDELFRETFVPFGTITSARIMRDEQNNNKGFGFVAFDKPEEAYKALETNGKLLKGKPIMVTMHQRKEVRRAQLVANFGRRGNFVAAGQQQSMMYPGMMYQQQPNGQPFVGGPNQPGQPQRYNNPSFGGRGGNFPNQQGGRGVGFPGGRDGYPMPPYMMQGPGMMQGGNRNIPMVPGDRGNMPQMMMMGRGDGGRGNFRGPPLSAAGRAQPAGRGMQAGGRGGPIPNVKFTGQARNQPPVGQTAGISVQQQPLVHHANMVSGPLDDQILADADPQTQKNMIGEKLYPLISRQQPEQAGKITGMLLEMDNAELLHLLESPEALVNKIDEALDVLKKHLVDN